MIKLHFLCYSFAILVFVQSRISSPPRPIFVSRRDKSFTLRWPPTKSIDPLTGANRIECAATSEKPYRWREKAKIFNGHPRNYEITKLKKGTRYRCRIAFSYHSKIIYSQSISVKTHFTMIAPPPANFRVWSPASPVPLIRATWRDPVGFRGDVAEFVISIREKSNKAKPFQVTAPGTKHSVDIRTVKPFAHYLVKIYADTGDADGGYSRELKVFTNVIRFSPPVAFKVIRVKDHSASLRWDASVGKEGSLAPAYLLLCTGVMPNGKIVSIAPESKRRLTRAKRGVTVVGYRLQGSGNDVVAYEEKKDGRVIKRELLNLHAYTKYSCTVQARGPAGLGRKSETISFQTKTTAPLAPKQPDLIISDPAKGMYTFRLYPTSNVHGPISYYELLVVPRTVGSSGNLNPIRDPPDVYFAQTALQEPRVAAMFPHPRPYIAARFPSNALPASVALVSPSWNASSGVVAVPVLWNKIRVSLSLRAFVESTDASEQGEYYTSSRFSDAVLIDFAAAAAAAPILPVVKTPGNMNIVTIIVLSSIILTLIAAGAVGILWTRISESCRKPQRGKRSPMDSSQLPPPITSAVYGRASIDTRRRSSTRGILLRLRRMSSRLSARLFGNGKSRQTYTNIPSEDLASDVERDVVLFSQEKQQEREQKKTRKKDKVSKRAPPPPPPLAEEEDYSPGETELMETDQVWYTPALHSSSTSVVNEAFSPWAVSEDLSRLKNEMEVEVSSSSAAEDEEGFQNPKP